MANKKISELAVRTPSLTDLMLVGDPSTGYSYKATLSALSTLLEANISLNDLSDVTITSPTAGQVLSYNGTAWVNDTNGITGSGTTNYVTKFTSSSAIGNSQIFDNGSSVGIGTATPSASALLELKSSGDVSLRINSSSASSGDLYITSVGSGNESRIDKQGTAGPLTFYNNGSERMRLDASGNLGLGTSSPSYKLDVNGTGGFADNVIAEKGQNATTKFEAKNTTVGTSSDAAFIATSDASAGVTVFGKKSSGVTTYKILTPSAAYWYNGTAGDISIINDFASGSIKMSAGGSSTAQLTLDASGNLGLGVTPSAWSASYKAIQISSYAAITQGGNDTYIGNNWYNDGTNKYLQTNGASLYGQSNGSHVWYNAPSGTAGNAISFTQAMTLDASGRLGISTTSPLSLLHINGSSSGAVQAYIQNSNGGTNSSAELVFGTWSGAIPTGSGNPGPSAKIVALNTNNSNAATDLIFHTYAASGTSAERMRITSGGNVGISTNSPAVKLDVVGSDGIRTSSDQSTSAFIGLAGSASEGRITVSSYGGYQPMTFYTGGSERMRITSGGELLINTTSDAGDYKLQVKGNAWIGGVSYPNITFDSDATSVNFSFYSASSNNYLGLSDGTNDLLKVTSAGNLEIPLGSIKTAAPSGGTAKPFKIGAAATVTPTSQNRTIEIEIDGTTYYLTAKTTND